MRAARMHGNKDVRVDDVPRPELSPGKALVEIEWCGICGSDLHEYLEGLSCPLRLPPVLFVPSITSFHIFLFISSHPIPSHPLPSPSLHLSNKHPNQVPQESLPPPAPTLSPVPPSPPSSATNSAAQSTPPTPPPPSNPAKKSWSTRASTANPAAPAPPNVTTNVPNSASWATLASAAASASYALSRRACCMYCPKGWGWSTRR